MAEHEIHYLGDVRRLALQPGDVIVLSVPGRVTAEARYGISEKMRAVFPGHACLVLEEGMDIGVIAAGESTGEPGTEFSELNEGERCDNGR